MKYLKSLGFIIAILVTFLILVLVRISNKNIFKQDAEKAIKDAESGNVFVSIVDLNRQAINYVVVDLGAAESYIPSKFKNSLNVPFENILEIEKQNILKKEKGEIVLFSEHTSIASRAWILLNQMGYSNVFILQDDKTSEVFKYKFQPDTVAAKLE